MRRAFSFCSVCLSYQFISHAAPLRADRLTTPEFLRKQGQRRPMVLTVWRLTPVCFPDSRECPLCGLPFVGFLLTICKRNGSLL
jgi:hypothetical protein